ncbi:hypothetical protein FOA52_000990 [Chlamydomonas sp. UWO 241]|nr:hypothetical protein FOA52_000990 [Chlamydomonas sp. UWO 241]
MACAESDAALEAGLAQLRSVAKVLQGGWLSEEEAQRYMAQYEQVRVYIDVAKAAAIEAARAASEGSSIWHADIGPDAQPDVLLQAVAQQEQAQRQRRHADAKEAQRQQRQQRQQAGTGSDDDAEPAATDATNDAAVGDIGGYDTLRKRHTRGNSGAHANVESLLQRAALVAWGSPRSSPASAPLRGSGGRSPSVAAAAAAAVAAPLPARAAAVAVHSHFDLRAAGGDEGGRAGAPPSTLTASTMAARTSQQFCGRALRQLSTLMTGIAGAAQQQRTDGADGHSNGSLSAYAGSFGPGQLDEEDDEWAAARAASEAYRAAQATAVAAAGGGDGCASGASSPLSLTSRGSNRKATYEELADAAGHTYNGGLDGDAANSELHGGGGGRDEVRARAGSGGGGGSGAHTAARNAALSARGRVASILIPVTQRGLVSAAYMRALGEEQNSRGQQHAPAQARLAGGAGGDSSDESPLSGAVAGASLAPTEGSARNGRAGGGGSAEVALALSAVQSAALCDMLERELEELVRPHLPGGGGGSARSGSERSGGSDGKANGSSANASVFGTLWARQREGARAAAAAAALSLSTPAVAMHASQPTPQRAQQHAHGPRASGGVLLSYASLAEEGARLRRARTLPPPLPLHVAMADVSPVVAVAADGDPATATAAATGGAHMAAPVNEAPPAAPRAAVEAAEAVLPAAPALAPGREARPQEAARRPQQRPAAVAGQVWLQPSSGSLPPPSQPATAVEGGRGRGGRAPSGHAGGPFVSALSDPLAKRLSGLVDLAAQMEAQLRLEAGQAEDAMGDAPADVAVVDAADTHTADAADADAATTAAAAAAAAGCEPQAQPVPALAESLLPQTAPASVPMFSRLALTGTPLEVASEGGLGGAAGVDEGQVHAAAAHWAVASRPQVEAAEAVPALPALAADDAGAGDEAAAAGAAASMISAAADAAAAATAAIRDANVERLAAEASGSLQRVAAAAIRDADTERERVATEASASLQRVAAASAAAATIRDADAERERVATEALASLQHVTAAVIRDADAERERVATEASESLQCVAAAASAAAARLQAAMQAALSPHMVTRPPVQPAQQQQQQQQLVGTGFCAVSVARSASTKGSDKAGGSNVPAPVMGMAAARKRPRDGA